MKEGLTHDDYVRAAERLGVSVAAVKAVAVVESRSVGFLSTGEPVILFERHWMHRLLRQKGIKPPENSPVAMIKSGGYVGGVGEHKRLQEAVLIDRECALQATSWGLFQIMGFHYKLLGFNTVQGFINKMYESEAAHLDVFVTFIEKYNNGVLKKALLVGDWENFARVYNGPAAIHIYAPRMREAFLRFANR